MQVEAGNSRSWKPVAPTREWTLKGGRPEDEELQVVIAVDFGMNPPPPTLPLAVRS